MSKIRIVTCLLVLILITGCTSIEVDDPENITSKYDSEMYTPTPTTKTLPKSSQQELIINLTPHQYTYNDLEYDIFELQKLYGDKIHIDELCNTLDGRKVYDIVIGDLDKENQILIFGAMHAREYITSQIVMRQLCNCIDALSGYEEEYNGISIKELLEDVTIHFIPMSNPDGVTISQLGPSGILDENVRSNVIAMGGADYEQWKANANGVDLNRNFDAGWDEFVGSQVPSSDMYKGSFPGSEPESAALIKLTQDYNIERTISYHTCGALIYWYYKQEGYVLKESRMFAESISDETGYELNSDYTTVDAAGFKDWAVYKMGIPSVTIEVGNENGEGIVNPVPIDHFSAIWERNKNVVYATLYNIKYE